MGTEYHLVAELVLDGGLEILEFDGALGRFHGQLHAGAKVEGIYRPLKLLRDLSEQLDPRYCQAWAVTAVRHGDQVDLIVPRKLAISLLNPLVTLRAANTRVVLDSLAVKNRYVGHEVFLTLLS